MSTSQSASHEMSSEPAHMTGAQSLIASLEASGVDVVFGIPGGAILPAYDPMMDSTKVRHILVRHEQGAGHAAGGDAPTQGEAKKAGGGGFKRKSSIYLGFESESPTQSKHDTLIAIPKGNVMSRMKAFENADC